MKNRLQHLFSLFVFILFAFFLSGGISQAFAQVSGETHNPSDDKRRFSSIWANNAPGRGHARSQLNSRQAWSAARNDVTQWLEIPVEANQRVTGIMTQGRSNYSQWVTSYRVQAKLRDGRLVDLQGGDVLKGNHNRSGIVSHSLEAPADTAAIRILPVSWYHHISMRAALLVAETDPQNNNLIENGSFEEHGALNRRTWDIFTSIPGWQVESGHIEIQRGRTGGIKAAEGQDKLELDAYRNSVIYTDIATQSGQQYQLSFYYSPRVQRRRTNTNDVEIWWGDNKVASLSGDRRGWQYHSVQVTADSDISRLRLKGAGRSDSYGGLLDDVSLTVDSNLIENGSFETHGRLNRGRWGTFNSIPGWQAESGQIELQRDTVGGIRSVDGRDKLELDAYKNSVVYTDITTASGKRYQLSLYYTPRMQWRNTDTNNVEVWWDDKKLITLSGDYRTWQYHTLEVEAQSGQSRLRLKGVGKNDSLGGLIDSVELHCLNCSGSSNPDRDGDGVPNEEDAFPDDPTEWEDTDSDGIGNNADTDDDNDGVEDNKDAFPLDKNESVDTDGDGIGNNADTDDDNDGIEDSKDSFPLNANEFIDSDSDGIGNNADTDDDNDGVEDSEDAFPLDKNESLDTDSDGVGNNTDEDDDNDGVDDNEDVFPLDKNESVDADGDGIGDNGDTDDDNDGVEDSEDAFPLDKNESLDTDGDGTGNNADTDDDGDGVLDEDDVFPLDANETSDLDGDGIGDNSDPDRDGDGVANEDDYFPDDASASSVPTVQIISPTTLSTVGSSPIMVEGTIDDANATLIINGIEVSHNNGTFMVDVALEEGANTIIVRAIDEQNHEGTATITVSLDKTPPYITIQSPESGSTVYTDIISVSGLVNDIVRGTVSEDEATVTVSANGNTTTASVSNRSYLAEGIQLQEGSNTLTIHAIDAVGNEASEEIEVTYQPQVGRIIELVSGDMQESVIQSEVADELVVKLSDESGAVADKAVVFRVTQGNGVLQPDTDAEGNGAVVQTNAEGEARVSFRLGSRAGVGNHKVIARAVGFEGEIEFSASATYGEGTILGVIAGNNQRGAVRQPLPQPLVIALNDDGANLIPDAELEFKVTQGSGTFSNGETAYRTTTDKDGRASASFILGAEEGLDVQRVTVTLLGSNITAGFTASGLMPGEPGQTTITGVVLDNQDQPVPDVTIRVDGSSRQAVTDEEGQFTLTEAPVGPVHLLVEGSTTSRDGEWPSLSYNIVTVPGAVNPLSSPIFLVEIDTENAVMVGAEDTIVTHPDMPGFALDVKAGSVTFPDGSKEGMLSITRVNANKVPMPPPNGMQPQFIVTIQPHGAAFDPPARLTLPNTDGHLPLSQVEMYSYDHDLEEFVTIGLGTVSKDGMTITSNPGSGVIKAGWHCGSQPGGNGCCSGPDRCDDYCAEPEDTSVCTAGCRVDEEKPLKPEDQTPGNCQKELCGGSEVNDFDEPLTDDVKGDCQTPYCWEGKLKHKDDDYDIPDVEDKTGDCKTPACNEGVPFDDWTSDETPSEEYFGIDAYCLVCSGDNEDGVEPTHEELLCDFSGDLEKACYICQEGQCKAPDCKASNETEDFPGQTAELLKKQIKKIEEKINKATKKFPLLSVNLGVELTGNRKESYTCCDDCLQPKPSEKGFPKTENTASVGGTVTATLGLSQEDKDKMEVKAVAKIGSTGKAYRFFLKVSSPKITGDGELGGEVGYSVVMGCPDEACGLAGMELKLNIKGEFGAGVDVGYDVFSPSAQGCSEDDAKIAEDIDECWGSGGTVGVSAITYVEADGLNAKGDVRFAPQEGGQCENEGVSCSASIGKTIVRTEYYVDLNPFQDDKTISEESKPITVFDGYEGACE